MLAVILPHANCGQGLVAEAEGVALASGDKRLLGVRVGLGEALQRLQLLDPEPAVPEAQGAHLGAVQLNAPVLVRVEYAQVVHFAGGGAVAGVPDPEGHVGQPVEGDGVLFDDLNDRPLMVLEVGGVVPVRVEGDELAGGILQPGGGHRFFGNFIYPRQEVLQLGAARAVRLDLVHAVPIRRADGENGVLDWLPAVRVIFIDVEVGSLMVFQHDSADLPRKQLHMMLFQVDDVIIFCGGFHQGIDARFQPFPQNFALAVGDAVQVVTPVLDPGQPEGDALQGCAVRTGFRQEEVGLLGVGEHELDVLVGLQLNDALEVVDHIAGALQFLHHHCAGGQLGQVDGSVRQRSHFDRPPAPVHRRKLELCIGDGLGQICAVHLD